MPTVRDRSATSVALTPLPGVHDDQTEGARYALGQPPRLRKMKFPGRDPGLVRFDDRQAALLAALAVFKFGGGCGTLLLYRECPTGPEGSPAWVKMAFLTPDVPALEPVAQGGGRYAAPEPPPAARKKSRNSAGPG